MLCFAKGIVPRLVLQCGRLLDFGQGCFVTATVQKIVAIDRGRRRKEVLDFLF